MKKDIVSEIKERAKALGACELIEGVKSVSDLVRLTFSAQGREFCQKNDFISRGMLAEIEEELAEHNIVMSAKHNLRDNADAMVVGATIGAMTIDDAETTYKVIVADGGKVRLRVKGYACVVVTLMDEACECELDKDETAVVLWEV